MLMLKQNTKGFSVIELLIGLAVFAVTLPAIASGVNSLIVLNDRARDLAVANMVAESKAEELRSLGFNALPVDSGPVDMSDELPYDLATPNTATYEVTNPSPGIAEVVVSITYDDYGNTDQILEYKTTISELGVGQ